MNPTINQWLKSRVTMATGKSAGELTDLLGEISSRAFFVSRCSKAAIANSLREISEAYIKGKLSMTDAQESIRNLYGKHTDSAAQGLMQRARATQMLNTQRQLARGVAEWQSWQKNKEIFPYIRYHASGDNLTRPAHRDLDGKIFSVDDPFLRTHMPGKWDYNCRCWGEPLTVKQAEKAGHIQPRGSLDSPAAKSGFRFDPSNAFLPDASELKDKSRIVQEISDSVKNGQIRKIGMIVTNPKQKYDRAHLTGLQRMTELMQDNKQAVRKLAVDRGWKKTDDIKSFQKSLNGAKIPEQYRKDFSDILELGNISKETCMNAGLGDKSMPVIMNAGSQTHGLLHNWHHHKEMFLDPEEGERVLKATLGNPNSQIHVNFSMDTNKKRKHLDKKIVFFDPSTNSYCVLYHNESNKNFQLVSWHHASSAYGDGELEILKKNGL